MHHETRKNEEIIKKRKKNPLGTTSYIRKH